MIKGWQQGSAVWLMMAVMFFQHSSGSAGFSPPATLYPDNNSTSRSGAILSIAAGSAGQFGAVWTCNTTATLDTGVLFSRTTNNGASWSSPIDLSQSAITAADSSDQPVLATDGGNTWIVTWDGDKATSNSLDASRDIYIARSTDSGQNWTPPTVLNSNSTDLAVKNTGPSLATDGGGNWVAVWESVSSPPGSLGMDYDLLVATSSDNGNNWSAPTALVTDMTSDTLNDQAPRVATDKAGTWVTAWQTRTTSGTAMQDVYCCKSTNNGLSWSSSARVSRDGVTDPGADVQPQIASAGAGKWEIIFTSYDSLGGSLPGNANILYARSTDNATTFSSPAILNLDYTAGLYCANPSLAYGNGLYTAAWDESTTGGYQVRYAQSSNGISWSAPQAIGYTLPTASLGFRPSIGASAGGALVAGWIEGNEDHTRRLFSSYNAGTTDVREWMLFE